MQATRRYHRHMGRRRLALKYSYTQKGTACPKTIHRFGTRSSSVVEVPPPSCHCTAEKAPRPSYDRTSWTAASVWVDVEKHIGVGRLPARTQFVLSLSLVPVPAHSTCCSSYLLPSCRPSHALLPLLLYRLILQSLQRLSYQGRSLLIGLDGCRMQPMETVSLT